MKHIWIALCASLFGLYVQTVDACTIADTHARNELKRKLFSEQSQRAYRMPDIPLSKAFALSVLRDSRLCPREVGFEYIGWDEFREKVLTSESVDEGATYIAEYGAAFAIARNTYGVEPQVIAAIIRVESHFGRDEHLGLPLLVNNLYRRFYLSVGKNFSRERFAAVQIGYLLALAEKYGWDLFSPKWKSSPAGAFGIPQFIPESFWRYAVDGDDDDSVDLFSHGDAILSVANYLIRRGRWQQDDRASHERAIASYNPNSVRYLELVLEYRSRLKERLQMRFP